MAGRVKHSSNQDQFPRLPLTDCPSIRTIETQDRRLVTRSKGYSWTRMVDFSTATWYTFTPAFESVPPRITFKSSDTSLKTASGDKSAAWGDRWSAMST